MICVFAECLIEDRFVQVVFTGTSMSRSPGVLLVAVFSLTMNRS